MDSEEITKTKREIVNPLLGFGSFILVLILFNLTGDFLYRISGNIFTLEDYPNLDSGIRFSVKIFIPVILSILLIVYQSKIIKKEYSDKIGRNILLFSGLTILIIVIYIITNCKG